jgi:hypothetical protein
MPQYFFLNKESFFLPNFDTGVTYLGSPSLAWILIRQWFKGDNDWHIIRIPDNLMNRSAQINIAQIIHQATSAKIEKRKDFRISLHLPLEYYFPESSRLRLAYMVDICEGGLLMHNLEKLEIGQNLRVKFYYDSATGMECIQALGKVIRVDRMGKSEKEFRCALEFSDLSSENLKKLRRFLKSLY